MKESGENRVVTVDALTTNKKKEKHVQKLTLILCSYCDTIPGINRKQASGLFQ